MYFASESVPDVQFWISRSMPARVCWILSSSAGLVTRSAASFAARPSRDAADLDAVVNIAHRKFGGDEASGRPRRDEALFLEAMQHEAQGRARHVQARGQRNFADALARPELAAQQQLAHPKQCSQSLGFVLLHSRHCPSPYHVADGVSRPPSFVCSMSKCLSIFSLPEEIAMTDRLVDEIFNNGAITA